MNSYSEARERAMQEQLRRDDAMRQREQAQGYLPECASRAWLLAGCSRRQHDAAVAAESAKAQASTLRQAVTGMLADGDCNGAVQAALRGNDIALAREAREFCRGD